MGAKRTHLGGRLCLGVKLDDDFTNCLIWGESNAFFAVECRVASPNFLRASGVGPAPV